MRSGREYGDGELERQVLAFIDYRARGGPLSFVAWMEAKDFAPADRSYMEASYMAMTVGAGVAS